MSYSSTEYREADEEETKFQIWARDNGYDLGEQSNSERANMLFQWSYFCRKKNNKGE